MQIRWENLFGGMGTRYFPARQRLLDSLVKQRILGGSGFWERRNLLPRANQSPRLSKMCGQRVLTFSSIVSQL